MSAHLKIIQKKIKFIKTYNKLVYIQAMVVDNATLCGILLPRANLCFMVS